MKQVGILTLEYIQEVVCQLGEQYGAERIWLFGSYARGEATEDSDVDLRIDKGRIFCFEYLDLIEDLEEALGVSVDLVGTSSILPYFKERITKEEILLYEDK